MSPEAKSRDLMYVAGTYGAVYIFSLPRGKQVGYLTGFTATYGLCADQSGNVWIPDYGFASGTIFKYPHGASAPVEALSVPGVHPAACSVDPNTGNLAVVGPSTVAKNPGVITVFGTEGSSQTYSVPFNGPQNCAFDGSSNLFVDGYSNEGSRLRYYFGELGKGEGSFRQVSLHENLRYAAPIQWDGQYLVLGNFGHIDRFSIRGTEVSRVSRVRLSKIGVPVGLAIDGATLVATNGGPAHGTIPPIQIYRYPKGGHPAKTVKNVSAHHIPFAAQGVTISTAPQ